MSDIVERLRKPVMLHSNPEQTNAERCEAAAEIERLNALVEASDRSEAVIRACNQKISELELWNRDHREQIAALRAQVETKPKWRTDFENVPNDRTICFYWQDGHHDGFMGAVCAMNFGVKETEWLSRPSHWSIVDPPPFSSEQS